MYSFILNSMKRKTVNIENKLYKDIASHPFLLFFRLRYEENARIMAKAVKEWSINDRCSHYESDLNWQPRHSSDETWC